MSKYYVWIFLVIGIAVGALISLLTDVNVVINMIIGALAGAAVGYFLKVKVENKNKYYSFLFKIYSV